MLENTVVNVEMKNSISNTVITQIYINNLDHNISGELLFPVPLNSVVNNLEVSINDQKLETRFMTKEIAERFYDYAKSLGSTASIAEQENPNNLKVKIGTVKKGEPQRCF